MTKNLPLPKYSNSEIPVLKWTNADPVLNPKREKGGVYNMS
jgi:hypothetical protein